MKSKLARLLESKNIKNSGWIIGEQVFRMLIQLVVGVITARYLGPSNYGSLNYTASFVTFFTSIATLGMDGVIIKKLIERPDEEGVYSVHYYATDEMERKGHTVLTVVVE